MKRSRMGTTQKMKKDLIVSLFVHDIKAPLAVIDMGARSLLSDTDRHVSLTSDQTDLLREIIETRNRAVSVLNRILGEGQSEATDRPLAHSGSLIRLFQAVTKWGNRFLKKPESLQHSASTVSALDELKTFLVSIAENIDRLQKSVASLEALTSRRAKTMSRMLRNAKLAGHLAGNAVHLIGPGGIAVDLADCKISEITKRALVEVFDVMDTDVSERLQSCEVLAEIDAILVDAGVFLSIDDRLWDTAYRLDCGKIVQVILNLLLNAMKFRRSRIDFSVRRKDSQLIFSVKDDGEGIAAAYHDKIFEYQFQAGPQIDFPIRGHGIGLAGSQALLKEMNGRLLLDSDGRLFTRFSAAIDCRPEGESGSVHP
jgi:signal transduction histidine kinase